MEGELVICIEGSAWEVGGEGEFDLEAWKMLELEAAADFPGLEISSKLTFDPHTAELKKLASDLALEVHGWEIDAGLDLYPDHCWTDLRAQIECGACELDVKTRLGASKAFAFDFYRADVGISFETCGTPVEIEARFTQKKGFEWIDVETLLPLPPTLSWVKAEVDARLTLSGKEMSFEPEFAAEITWAGASASIELFGQLVALGTLGIDGLAFVGVVLDASRDGVWIESRTSFDPAWNKRITGNTAYGRVVGIGYEAEDRCDRTVSAELWIYTVEFGEPFDWDRAALTLAVLPTGSREFSLTACLEPGSVVEAAFRVDINW